MKPETERYILENLNKRSIKELSEELHIDEYAVRKFLSRKKRSHPSAHDTAGRSKEPLLIILVIFLIFLGFAVYANSFKGEFVWDDLYLISKNAYIKDWNHLRISLRKIPAPEQV